jgi:hypothetical protein
LFLVRHQKKISGVKKTSSVSAPDMLHMSERGQSRLGYAEKAERRAQFALGYLVTWCVMLILIAGVLISVS